ncbi:MAG: FKBP-type peptidyl-prolyl cis-trans isomerase [Candidatus Pacebacteria bacterium]|nr:FKBP-type peptidyl-prolyl cis-trans isomerase [Candidatus Paceibacterota bacterium]MCF7857223.1 FKBP-type peptidyl-prolyl cis-trans isomerase [Candidatus Paceibacterota bacterium]
MFCEPSYDSPITINYMNLFNKYEAVGILLSIGLMALVLTILNTQGNTLALNDSIKPETQSAVVAVAQEKPLSSKELENALRDASTGEGELVKLVIDDVKIGSGEGVKNGDSVTVNYIGTTQDGVRFDSSYERGTPFTFTVGAGKVIQGWEKGLIGMKIGGERILVIPSDMAYGNRQIGSIPPNSTLIFSVELLSVK